jgi:FKBP-type peptidyl-prolyl cis-trans isomerase
MRSVLLSVLLAAGLAMPLMADDKATAPANPGDAVAGMAKAADAKIEEAKKAADDAAKMAADAAAKVADAAGKKWVIPADAKPAERKELEGGLIIEDFVVGSGALTPEGATVVINYHGTLKDTGNVFDSSFERGEPVAFPLGQLIPGWQKGIPGMKVGGLRRLTIPYAMAYGEEGRPPTIPAKSDLVFIVEMLNVVDTAAKPTVTEVAPGTGEESVAPLSVVVTNHKITDSTGKVIHETAGKPYIWFPGELAQMSEAVAGMKTGGKRKVVIPAGMITPAPGLIKLPYGQDITIEAEVVMFRNLPTGPGGR